MDKLSRLHLKCTRSSSQPDREPESAPDIITLRELRVPSQTSIKSETKGDAASGRQWIKGVRLCGWIISGVLCVNVILTVIATILTYVNAGNGSRSFYSTSVYKGSCSVAKKWTTGLHFLINILSTTMLATSNYSMQCLASPSRAEVNEAHQKRGWLKIGVPNIFGLLLFGKGRRRRLGFVLLLTSLPIHLIYNSAVYFALGPSTYGIAMGQVGRTLESAHQADDGQCSMELFNMSISTFKDPNLRKLSKRECMDTFAQDYVYGHKAVLFMASTPLPDTQGLLYLGKGHEGGNYAAKERTPYSWMCKSGLSCSREALDGEFEDWTLDGSAWSTQAVNLTFPRPDDWGSVRERWLYRYQNRPDYKRLYDIWQNTTYYGEEQLRADLDNAALWDNSSWAQDVELLGHSLQCGTPGQPEPYKVDHCLTIPAKEQCQLVTSPLICVLVIGCNAIKLLCIFLAARDDRSNILLTVGDAIASFLTRPDPATKDGGLLSHADVKKGALGWHESYLEHCPCELCDSRRQTALKTTVPLQLTTPKKWIRAASTRHWLCVFSMCVILLGLTGYLLSLGVINITTWSEGTNIWDYALGETSKATLITGVNVKRETASFVGVILLANLPQLLVSVAYFMYNTLLSCMLLASEYNNYATERKPLRVSWPKGIQRSSYYLSLPYRYGIPLFVTSAVLHWLISQSLFFVEIIPHDMDGNPLGTEDTVVSCGYSPQAIIYAMICGGVMLAAALSLGAIQFKSSMPLALHCSAAISAACHPQNSRDGDGDGDADHALKPVQWGEVVLDPSDPGRDLDQEWAEAEEEYERRRSADGSMALTNRQGRYLDFLDRRRGHAHCSFTSGEVVEPTEERLYS